MREAESPLLGGDRLHCRVCRFLKIKTGLETACLYGGWCPPTPHSYSKVFPSSSKHMLSSSGQYPSLCKRRKGQQKKNKSKPQTPALRCQQHEDHARAKGPRAQRSVSTSPVIATVEGATTTQLAESRWEAWGGGRAGGGGSRRKQSREHSASRRVEGCGESPPWGVLKAFRWPGPGP